MAEERPQEGMSSDALYAAAMMAAMEEEERKRQQFKYLEGLLPIALLLILGVFLGAKLGIFDFSFLPWTTKTVNVMILSDQDSSEIKALSNALTSQYARYMNIQVAKYVITPTTRIWASNLGQYDVVILYQTGKKMLSAQQREELAKYVNQGGKLIIVKNSGTYMPLCDVVNRAADPNCSIPEWVGWKDLEDFVPVSCVDEESCQPSVISGRIISVDREHPVMGGLEKIPDEKFLRLNVVKNISISKIGRVIADVEEISGSQVIGSYPGIVVSTTLMGGKVVYFNYDPQDTSILLVNAIDWLT